MMTIPQTVPKKLLRIMIENNDCKKWIIGKEEGKNGYKHYQIRLSTSNPEFFDWCKKYVPQAHIEECTDKWEYERKEGRYWASWDKVETRKERFGEPKGWQRTALKRLRTQNDRQVDVWYDPVGNRGKSWLAGHLFETCGACIVPRDWNNPSEITNYLVHNYNDEPIIVIDIPRETDIPKGFYATVEMIKDGLIGTTKWEGKMRNIRGVKILILTNKMMDLKKLSKDRWRLNGINTENAQMF
ncbi:MAG: replication-associated protein [Smacoviridae sp.]|uniref:Replication-associated protein n=1 Tax=Smacoviridae sp. TaxID=2715094 RepID=A0A6G8R5D6_9VIRU|nr:MAG: replication-associated protein [Smacoviridae sp.]QIN96627.1 MAG: replication-associated protein [Smacoviridae sp.]